LKSSEWRDNSPRGICAGPAGIDEDGWYRRTGRQPHDAARGALMNQEERERRVFRIAAGTLMVCLLTYGCSLIAYQSYNQKKRADLPQTITLQQHR